ncbi:MAG: hypothetical protein H6734_24970 [Alphaproteobacteria bacterium]|nr:hypothetical protein [Alphaproteobacteria bacterium]
MFVLLLACTPEPTPVPDPEPTPIPEPTPVPVTDPTGQWVLDLAPAEVTGSALSTSLPHRITLVVPDASGAGAVFVRMDPDATSADFGNVTVTRLDSTLTLGPVDTAHVDWTGVELQIAEDGSVTGDVDFDFRDVWGDMIVEATVSTTATGAPDTEARVLAQRPLGAGPVFPWDTAGVDVIGLEPLTGLDAVSWRVDGTPIAATLTAPTEILGAPHRANYAFADLQWGDVLIPDLDGLVDLAGNAASYESTSFTIPDPPVWDGTDLEDLSQALDYGATLEADVNGQIPTAGTSFVRIGLQQQLVLRRDVTAGQTLHLDVASVSSDPASECGIDVRLDGALTELYRAPTGTQQETLAPLAHALDADGDLVVHAWCTRTFAWPSSSELHLDAIRVE